jgi:hypothetical protein
VARAAWFHQRDSATRFARHGSGASPEWGACTRPWRRSAARGGGWRFRWCASRYGCRSVPCSGRRDLWNRARNDSRSGRRRFDGWCLGWYSRFCEAAAS